MVLHPIEKIEHLTYGVMIERLFSYGEDVSSLAALESDMAIDVYKRQGRVALIGPTMVSGRCFMPK